MASNLQRLGGYIGGKVTGAAASAKDSLIAGAKASVYEANPALFGSIESGIRSLQESFKKGNSDDEKRAREEQARNKRSRGVVENNAREQAYKDKLDSDRLVSMDSTLKKILKALTKKDDEQDFGILGKLAEAIGSLIAFLAKWKLLTKLITPDWLKKGIKTPKPSWLDKFKGFKFAAPKWLDNFKNFFKNFKFPKFVAPKWFDSFKNFKFPKFPRPVWIDDLAKLMNTRIGSAAGNTKLPTARLPGSKIPKLPDAIKPPVFAPGGALAAAAEGATAKTATAMTKIMSSMKAFFKTLVPVTAMFKSLFPEVGVLLKSGSKMLKVVPVLGTIVMAIEGLFLAFNTEKLQGILDKEVITMPDRASGLVGGAVGSVAGIFDLIFDLFGIELDKSVQSTVEEWTTKVVNVFTTGFGDLFKIVGATAEILFGSIEKLIFGESESFDVGSEKLKYFNKKYLDPLRNIADLVMNKIGWSISYINVKFQEYSEILTGIWDGLMLGFDYIAHSMNVAVGEYLLNPLAEASDTVSTFMQTKSIEIKQMLFELIDSVIGWVVDKVNGFVDTTNKILPSAFKISRISKPKLAMTARELDAALNTVTAAANQKSEERATALESAKNLLGMAADKWNEFSLEQVMSTAAENAEAGFQAADDVYDAVEQKNYETVVERAAELRELGLSTGLSDEALAIKAAAEAAEESSGSVEIPSGTGDPYDGVSPQTPMLDSSIYDIQVDQKDLLGSIDETLKKGFVPDGGAFGSTDILDPKITDDNLKPKDPSLATTDEDDCLQDSEPVNSELNPSGPVTLESQENLESSIDGVSEGVDGNTAAINAASETAQTSVAITEDNADHRTAEQIRVQQELERAAIQNRNEGVDRLLQGQSQLVQALMGPLLKGQEGGGPLGTLFDNLGSIFGKGKDGESTFFSKIGDIFGGKDGEGSKIGNFFKNLGGGEGGWFDKLTGTIGDFASVGEDIKNLFTLGGSGASSGTSLFSSPGFGGGVPAGMDPIAALLGGKLSEKLGLSGVGANAAFDLAQSLLTPGSGLAGIKGALAGPGGFAGGLGAALSVYRGDLSTPGGILSTGLGAYQMALGGGIQGIAAQGINAIGKKLIMREALQGQAAAASGGAITQTLAGNAGRFLGDFASGMSGGSQSLMQGSMGQTLGVAGGAVMAGFSAKGVADALSGGYVTNKHLNTAGGIGTALAVLMNPALLTNPIGLIVGGALAVFNRLFGRKAKEYKDIGMQVEIGNESSGQIYKDWIKKGGAYRSDKTGTEYENIDSSLVDYFNESAFTIQKSFGEIASKMGLNADAISGFSKSYKISLKGMNEKQQQEALAKAMVKYAEDAVKYSYGDVSKYSLEGEDTLTTFTRMASAVENVAYWFDALGSSAEQTAAMFDTFATSDYFLGTLNTSSYKATSPAGGGYGPGAVVGAEFIGGRYDQYIQRYLEQQGIEVAPSEQTEEQKLLARAAAQAEYIQMYGGEEEFAKVSGFYFENFYSAEEKAEFQSRQATKIAKEQMAALAESLALLENDLVAAGVDPNFVDKIGGFENREQFETAKDEYRLAIEAAAESGNMELHAQLMMAAKSFIDAGEMQLQAAKMAGELEEESANLVLDPTRSTGVDISRVGIDPPKGYDTWEAYDAAMEEQAVAEAERLEAERLETEAAKDDAANIETTTPEDTSSNIETGNGDTRDDSGSIQVEPTPGNGPKRGQGAAAGGGSEGNVIVSGGSDNSSTQINNFVQDNHVRVYHPIINANIRLPGIKIGHIGL